MPFVIDNLTGSRMNAEGLDPATAVQLAASLDAYKQGADPRKLNVSSMAQMLAANLGGEPSLDQPVVPVPSAPRMQSVNGGQVVGLGLKGTEALLSQQQQANQSAMRDYREGQALAQREREGIVQQHQHELDRKDRLKLETARFLNDEKERSLREKMALSEQEARAADRKAAQEARDRPTTHVTQDGIAVTLNPVTQAVTTAPVAAIQEINQAQEAARRQERGADRAASQADTRANMDYAAELRRQEREAMQADEFKPKPLNIKTPQGEEVFRIGNEDFAIDPKTQASRPYSARTEQQKEVMTLEDRTAKYEADLREQQGRWASNPAGSPSAERARQMEYHLMNIKPGLEKETIPVPIREGVTIPMTREAARDFMLKRSLEQYLMEQAAAKGSKK